LPGVARGTALAAEPPDDAYEAAPPPGEAAPPPGESAGAPEAPPASPPPAEAPAAGPLGTEGPYKILPPEPEAEPRKPVIANEPLPPALGRPLAHVPGPWGAAAVAMVGLRGSRTGIDGVDSEAPAFGLGGNALIEGIFSGGLVDARFTFDALLGGGEGGFEGRFGMKVLLGVIARIEDEHGPFLRGGLGGGLEGNDEHYYSSFELPIGDAGYAVFLDGFVVEAGFRGSAVLIGRWFAGEAERAISPAPRWGGFASAAVGGSDVAPAPAGWLDVEISRVQDDTPVLATMGRLCGGYYIGVCGEARLLHGEQRALDGTAHDTTSLYLGVTLGILLGRATADH
jgi:hypothetical protein